MLTMTKQKRFCYRFLLVWSQNKIYRKYSSKMLSNSNGTIKQLCSIHRTYIHNWSLACCIAACNNISSLIETPWVLVKFCTFCKYQNWFQLWSSKKKIECCQCCYCRLRTFCNRSLCPQKDGWTTSASLSWRSPSCPRWTGPGRGGRGSGIQRRVWGLQPSPTKGPIVWFSGTRNMRS